MTAEGEGEYGSPRWLPGSKAAAFGLGLLAGCILMLVLFQIYFRPRFNNVDQRLERVERGCAELRSEAEGAIGRAFPGRERAQAARASAP